MNVIILISIASLVVFGLCVHTIFEDKISKAYALGYNDGLRDLLLIDNPYSFFKQYWLYKQWEKGWRDARLNKNI